MTNDEIKQAVQQIITNSSSDEEIKQRLCDELGYPYVAAITSYKPIDQTGREVRAIAAGIGGLIRKDGAMVMVMMHGRDGVINL